jgi:uncharacterized protein
VANAEDSTTKPAERRPRMPVNSDNAFWMAGVERRELLAQRCSGCGRLRHPPAPMCGACRSLEWEAARLAGRGSIYSYVVHHRPHLPGFASPHVIVLVELEEGVRMVGNLVDADPSAAAIGKRVEVTFRADPGDDYVLPQWRLTEAS